MPAEVDIVIPTRGRGALIDATINSIRQGMQTDFALWVTDQSKDDATEQTVARHRAVDSRINYIHAQPWGSSYARNIGAAQGSAPYILFTDDDCIATPDWAQALIDELRRPATWAVFGRVLPDTTLATPQHAQPVSAALPMALKDAPARRVYSGNRLDLSFGHSANMGVRRDAFDRISGFDELLGVGGALRAWPDRDIGYRMLARGGAIIYAPAALIYHRHWRGWDEVRRSYRNYAIGAGAAALKYIRCGDPGGWYILGEWLLDQGVRQILSGIFKWRSAQKIQVGLTQLVYPWVGMFQSLHYAIDRERMVYRRP